MGTTVDRRNFFVDHINDNSLYYQSQFTPLFSDLNKLRRPTKFNKNKCHNKSEKIIYNQQMVHELPLSEILINTKDSFFEILDKLLIGELDKNIIIQNMYYIGIILIILSLIVFFLYFLTN